MQISVDVQCQGQAGDYSSEWNQMSTGRCHRDTIRKLDVQLF